MDCTNLQVIQAEIPDFIYKHYFLILMCFKQYLSTVYLVNWFLSAYFILWYNEDDLDPFALNYSRVQQTLI